MIKKTYSKTGKTCRVTFKLPAEAMAEEVNLVGEFNSWDETANSMRRLKDGSFSITISLKPGNSYRFRYLLNRDQWENDWQADGYLPNNFGSEDSIVEV